MLLLNTYRALARTVKSIKKKRKLIKYMRAKEKKKISESKINGLS